MSTRRLTFPLTRNPRPDELLTLRLSVTGPTAVIEVAGELDMSTSHLLTDLATSTLRDQAPSALVLDLTDLRFFCADGIRALVQTNDAATARSARLLLRNPSPMTRKVLTVTGMLDAFHVHQTADPQPSNLRSKLEAHV